MPIRPAADHCEWRVRLLAPGGCAVRRYHSAYSIVGPPPLYELLSFGLQSFGLQPCVSTGVLGLLIPYTSDIGATAERWPCRPIGTRPGG